MYVRILQSKAIICKVSYLACQLLGIQYTIMHGVLSWIGVYRRKEHFSWAPADLTPIGHVACPIEFLAGRATNENSVSQKHKAQVFQ